MDVAKRLIDLGFHPSTVYFPLVVDEAMMVEPTETESKETLDAFAAASRGRRGRRAPTRTCSTRRPRRRPWAGSTRHRPRGTSSSTGSPAAHNPALEWLSRLSTVED